MVKKEYSISMNDLGQYKVNDIVIKQEIFDKELFEYDIRERDDMIEHLIDWISEKYGLEVNSEIITSITNQFFY